MPAMSEVVGPATGGADRPSLEISNYVVALYKERFGKGPVGAKATIAGDTITVLLRGGLSVVEQTLARGDQRAAVRASRQSLDDLLAPEMREAVERIMGRPVAALMSAVNQDPDLTVHVFVLGD
jgi:uncharacterized protein YbcI